MSEHFREAAKRRQTTDELISLARMITFARQSAQSINADFPVYCLDLALGAVLEEIKNVGITYKAQLKLTGQTPDSKFH